MANPWDDLPPYESERIAGLDFDDMIAALCDHAPKASSADIVALFGNTFTKSEVKAARDRWKAGRGKDAAVFVPAPPSRDAIIAEMNKAIQLGHATDVDRWARALVTLGRAGNIDPEPETTEDWDRLSDLEAAVLIALTRKLNGEPLIEGEADCLAQLRA